MEQERRTQEDRLGDHDVRRLGRERGNERVVLQLGGPGEDVLDVVRNRLDALQLCSFGEQLVDGRVVEVGLGRQRQKRRAGRAHPVGEQRTRDEPHVVAALDEVLRDGQQWSHMTVPRDACDDDRRHRSP